jgi:hypothetical protein
MERAHGRLFTHHNGTSVAIQWRIGHAFEEAGVRDHLDYSHMPLEVHQLLQPKFRIREASAL